MSSDMDAIPDLTGTWKGTNYTISEDKGYQEWEKVVTITSQEDRRFRGSFDYSEGTIEFSGIIAPDNMNFMWVSKDSQGYNVGMVTGENTINSCYIEAGEQATAGCAVMVREESE